MVGDGGGDDENEAKSYELAFEEAGRALDAQERAVNESAVTRGRADCCRGDHNVVLRVCRSLN